jgi:hypothetical protein
MISVVQTTKGREALTSDRWHVVHARFHANGKALPFHRSISSEHDDRVACVRAARALLTKLRAESVDVPPGERDEVFVRRPGFKSIKVATARSRRNVVTKTDGEASA